MVKLEKKTIIIITALMIDTLPVHAQSLIEQIGWKGADISIIVGLVLTLITGVGILIFLHLQSRAQQKYELDRIAFQTFQKNVEKTELTDTEAKKLKSILRHANVTHPHIIFQSASLYERCIDAEVNFLLHQNISNDLLYEEETLLGSLRKKLGYGFLPYEHPLTSTRNIEIGQKVSIIDRRSKLPLIQNARITENNEFYFRIQYDLENEDSLGILEGQPVMLTFARQSDGIYGVQVVICKKDQSTFDLRHTLEITRNQMRQYARVDVNIIVKIRLLMSSGNEEKPVKNCQLEGRMVDISGGGGCIVNDKPLVPGDIVSLSFKVGDCMLNGIAARILRVSIQDIHDTVFYKHSLQFVNIEHSMREKIVKFVFEKQRQLNQWR